MSVQFTPAEWHKINRHLASVAPSHFGLPERRENSLIIASWNLRKFGSQFDKHGDASRSPQAFDMIENFCRRCDFIAIQEVQDSLWSIRHLRDRLNAAASDVEYRLISSDVAGFAPGQTGMKERMAFLYNAKKIDQTEIASDITFDKTAILGSVNTEIARMKAQVVSGEPATLRQRIFTWFSETRLFKTGKVPTFIQFKRSPHIVTFRVKGHQPDQSYDIACVNAHLIAGSSKRDREREFFALLSWMFLRAKNKVQLDAPITLLLADLNLDFKSNNDIRKAKIEEYLVGLNRGELKDHDIKANFPFLDIHPDQEREFRTNSREKETFDHIAWFAHDHRLPRASQNKLAGQISPDDFDFGMFNFIQLFRQSGVFGDANAPVEFEKIIDDVSDHMPVWLRLPIPHKNQHKFSDDH